MQVSIFCVKDRPEYLEGAVDWFASKWGIDRAEYVKSFEEMMRGAEALPKWFVATDEGGRIVGGCGLIQNDFVDRTDLFPYMCALYVEREARGHALGARLLSRARAEAAASGFKKVYLCTDHTSYYERYGWKHIATGHHPSGDTSRIYEASAEGAPEEMDEFFAARSDLYDEHMLREVEGCREGYEKMSELVPSGAETLLDIGCGTGLELEGIYRRLPALRVTGIDLSRRMLDILSSKFGDKAPELICGDYLTTPFGKSSFDCAVSFQTLHHLSQSEKLEVYKKLCAALKPGGVYIECDYNAQDDEEEQFYRAEYERIKRENGIPDGVHIHYDTPCAPETNARLLCEAGFSAVKKLWKSGNTVLVIAARQ